MWPTNHRISVMTGQRLWKERVRRALQVTLALVCIPATGWAGAMHDGRCEADDDGDFICGPVNAEDLVRVPGTDWVLASRMAGPGVADGAIYLLDGKNHSWRGVGIDEIPARHDTAAYPDCPGRPDAETFTGQGLAIDDSGETLELLAVGHGAREAVEVFTIATQGLAEPALTWIGCAVAPDGAQINSVAPVAGGGFAVTKFFDARDKDWGDRLMAGQETGSVLEWSREAGWSEAEGTALSGPNGILVSDDGSAYFVAEWSGRKLHRISRGITPARRQSLDLNMLADNLRWDGAGRILVVGQAVADIQDYVGCALSDAPICPDPYVLMRVAPADLSAETLFSTPGSPAFGSGTSAIELDAEFWIGTSRGNKIARVAKPARP